MVAQAMYFSQSINLVHQAVTLSTFGFPSPELGKHIVATYKAWLAYCAYREGSPGFTDIFSRFSQHTGDLEVFSHLCIDEVQNTWTAAIRETIEKVNGAMPVKDQATKERGATREVMAG